MHTIRHVSVGSAFKVVGTLTAFVWGVIGLFGVLATILGLGAAGVLGSNVEGGLSGLQALGLSGLGIAGVLIVYIVGLFFAWVSGGIVGAIYAILYNIVSGWVGGLKIELD